jgi:hypothetical protein
MTLPPCPIAETPKALYSQNTLEVAEQKYRSRCCQEGGPGLSPPHMNATCGIVVPSSMHHLRPPTYTGRRWALGPVVRHVPIPGMGAAACLPAETRCVSDVSKGQGGVATRNSTTAAHTGHLLAGPHSSHVPHALTLSRALHCAEQDCAKALRSNRSLRLGRTPRRVNLGTHGSESLSSPSSHCSLSWQPSSLPVWTPKPARRLMVKNCKTDCC